MTDINRWSLLFGGSPAFMRGKELSALREKFGFDHAL
jgi:hypothetical protein